MNVSYLVLTVRVNIQYFGESRNPTKDLAIRWRVGFTFERFFIRRRLRCGYCCRLGARSCNCRSYVPYLDSPHTPETILYPSEIGRWCERVHRIDTQERPNQHLIRVDGAPWCVWHSTYVIVTLLFHLFILHFGFHYYFVVYPTKLSGSNDLFWECVCVCVRLGRMQACRFENFAFSCCNQRPSNVDPLNNKFINYSLIGFGYTMIRGACDWRVSQHQYAL